MTNKEIESYRNSYEVVNGIGENVTNDKRILDSFNEFMNSGKVSGILIIEEI